MRAPAERTQAEEGGSAMTAASLPVLCTSFGDRLINPLYGYTEEMDAASLADSVFPFAESPEMTVTLLDGAAVPQSVSWEVRDEAGVRLIERGSTSAFRGSRSECSFSFPLQDLYEEETYYRLRFTVEMNGLTARYYTRIRKVSAENLEALAKYALAFHDAQFDKNAAAAYSAKLEPNDQADRGTLAYVDIHCSPDQISWGDSRAEQSSKTWMTVQAVHGGYGYFRFDYLARADFAGGVLIDQPVHDRHHDIVVFHRIRVPHLPRLGVVCEMRKVPRRIGTAVGLVLLGYHRRLGVEAKQARQDALVRLEVDNAGLDRMDRRMLATMIKKFAGGPVGLETLAASISEETDTITDVYEPFLIQLGFLMRTPRGRVVTRAGYEHMNIPYPGTDDEGASMSLFEGA